MSSSSGTPPAPPPRLGGGAGRGTPASQSWRGPTTWPPPLPPNFQPTSEANPSSTFYYQPPTEYSLQSAQSTGLTLPSSLPPTYDDEDEEEHHEISENRTEQEDQRPSPAESEQETKTQPPSPQPEVEPEVPKVEPVTIPTQPPQSTVGTLPLKSEDIEPEGETVTVESKVESSQPTSSYISKPHHRRRSRRRKSQPRRPTNAAAPPPVQQRQSQGPGQGEGSFVNPTNNQIYKSPCQIGVIPMRSAAFQAPRIPLPKLCKHVLSDDDGGDDEDGVCFQFKPQTHCRTEVTFTIEPKPQPPWLTMLNCGFKPMVNCSAPPCYLSPNGNPGMDFMGGQQSFVNHSFGNGVQYSGMANFPTMNQIQGSFPGSKIIDAEGGRGRDEEDTDDETDSDGEDEEDYHYRRYPHPALAQPKPQQVQQQNQHTQQQRQQHQHHHHHHHSHTSVASPQGHKKEKDKKEEKEKSEKEEKDKNAKEEKEKSEHQKKHPHRPSHHPQGDTKGVHKKSMQGGHRHTLRNNNDEGNNSGTTETGSEELQFKRNSQGSNLSRSSDWHG